MSAMLEERVAACGNCVVELSGVWKHYELGDARIAALRGVDFTLGSGQFTAVWGPSGSGKSTLCNLVGLIDEPTSGSVHFQGRDVSRLTDGQRSDLRNRAVGFVFQSFNLIPVLSALENVMLPLQIRGESTRKVWNKAMEGLEEVGLEAFANHRPDKLSGGQRQRVAIARALVTAPVLVVADEPTANLDSENAERIIQLMKKIGEKRDTTFLFSTHDQRLLNHVTRQVQLLDGCITEDRFFEN